MTHGRRKNRNQRSRVDFRRVIAEGKLAAVLHVGNHAPKCPYRAEPVVRAWLKGFMEERERMETRELVERAKREKEKEMPNENYRGHFR